MTSRRQRDAASILVAGFWLTCFTVAAFGEIGPPIGADKKLIGFAINSADAGYLREHVGDVERLPLDGLILFVYPDDWTGPRSGQEGMFFGGRRFTFDDFSRDLADLRAVPFKRFTDNFIQVEAAARGSAVTGREADGNLDWFDPAWDGIAENGRVVAAVAKAAGFKGIMLDIEFYGGSLGPWGGKHIFAYADSPSKDQYTLEETAQQVQRRGREFMAGVTQAYPDITILIIQDTGWGGADLVEHFVRGMLEARGRATVIDGGEGGYPLVTPAEFADYRSAAESRHKQEEIFAPMQYAFGVWVDYMPNQFGGWHTDPADFHKNYRTPQELEKTLYGALAASDKYVWIYTWHSAVWYTPIVRPRPQPGQCVLCPHGLVPDAYVESMVNCRKPHDLAWSPKVPSDRYFYFDGATVIEGQAADGTNLLENGDFENWTQTPAARPAGWLVSGQAPVAALVETDAKTGRRAARLTTRLLQGHVFFDQRVAAERFAGKTVTFSAWVKTHMKQGGGLQILDFVQSMHEVSSSEGHTGDGAWRRLSVTRTIRPDATGEVVFRLSAMAAYRKSPSEPIDLEAANDDGG